MRNKINSKNFLTKNDFGFKFVDLAMVVFFFTILATMAYPLLNSSEEKEDPFEQIFKRTIIFSDLETLQEVINDCADANVENKEICNRASEYEHDYIQIKEEIVNHLQACIDEKDYDDEHCLEMINHEIETKKKILDINLMKIM